MSPPQELTLQEEIDLLKEFYDDHYRSYLAVLGLLGDAYAEIERLRADLREIHSLMHGGEDLWTVGNRVHAIARAALEGEE